MGRGRFHNSVKKTIRYAKRNGALNAFFAVIERRAQSKKVYCYEQPSDARLRQQRTHVFENAPKISILVPAYEPKEEYFRELLESVKRQTYGNWELIIADAGKDTRLKEIADQYSATDARIFYHHLRENKGISANSNAALSYAGGAYTALLDHDDLLTPDALYEMACMALDHPEAVLIYSDEDKCDAAAQIFHSPHRKRDFDRDLFLTHNYICHFAMLKTDVLKKLCFRSEYDGAQDYDLFLRAALLEEPIAHVPKVLYHWRCHEASTAENTDSKQYAYEAGRLALDDYLKSAKIAAHAEHDTHFGYYRICYEHDMFAQRPEVGATGGRLVHFGKIVGGAMEKDGSVRFAGLPARYSGYMNRAVLAQQVDALDIRNMQVRGELNDLYEEYKARALGEDPVKMSLLFSEEVKKRGYILVYTPWITQKSAKKPTGR